MDDSFYYISAGYTMVFSMSPRYQSIKNHGKNTKERDCDKVKEFRTFSYRTNELESYTCIPFVIAYHQRIFKLGAALFTAMNC